MKFPHRKPAWTRADTPAELLAQTKTVPTRTELSITEIADMVCEIVGVPKGEICNFAVISLSHPGHRVVVISPGTAEQVYTFLKHASKRFGQEAL